MAKSSAYWRNRFLKIEEASNAYGVEAFQQIEPVFDKAQRAIQREIEIWYSRYARNNQISIHEARKALTAKELEELRWDVKEYIQKGQENAIDQRWMKELENASARVHISRLEALKLRTQQAAEVAFGNELDVIDTMARKVYTEDYYHSIFEVQKGFNIGWDIGTIDQVKLDKLIVKPWTADNKTFKDRIWQSKNQMVAELHQQLTRTCVLGKAPDEAIEALTKYVDKDIKNKKYVAGRLVMTEQAYFHSAAQKDAFNDLDVEEFEIVATLDSHTSQVCQDMDGTHLPMSQYEPGVTAPPFHVFCRSVTVPYFEDNFTGERAARDEDGNTYYIPDNMTYKDWKKSFVDGAKGLNFDKNGVIINTNMGAKSAIRNTGKQLKYNPNASFKVNIPSHDSKINENLSNACRKVAELGGKDGNEHLCLIDLVTGDTLYEELGDATSVGGPEFWQFLKENPNKQFSFIHNHNTDGCFSETDMRTLLRTDNIKEFVAVRIDGVIYCAEKASTPESKGMFDILFREELDDINTRLKLGEITAGERTRLREEIIVNGLLNKYTKGLMEFDT